MRQATYIGLDEWADAAEGYGQTKTSTSSVNWTGGTFSEALRLCRQGWDEGLVDILPIVEEALELIERDHPVDVFTTYHDVSGSEVDMGRYLGGIPENMIEYLPVTISKAGRTIALCASTCYSASVSVENIKRRGSAIVALALALEKAQHTCELWADISVNSSHLDGKATRVRILVKGVHDIVDPAKIAFAFAHPAAYRMLGFTCWEGLCKGRNPHGRPVDPLEDLPEGTIYLPAVVSYQNVDASVFVMEQLTKLGLVRGDV
jgi:hypothetical protein